MAKFDEKYFAAGKEPEQFEIESMLSEGEQILWRGKPKRSAFLLANVFKMLPVALIWLCFDGAFIGFMAAGGVFQSIPTGLLIFLIVFFAFHLVPVWLWIGNILTANRQHRNIDYVFTGTRIIIKSGAVGINIENIYYTEIKSVNLKVGLIDRRLHVGDIYITGTGKAKVLWDITNPYEVTARLQKIVNDIRTDMYYPNALRPESNEGYRTEYRGK